MKDCQICKKIQLDYAILMDYIMEKFKTFSVFDVGIFKVCLFAIGMLFGGFYSKFIKKNAFIIAVIAILSYVYLMYKVFFAEE